MQVQRQPNLTEIKRVTSRENLRTSQICEHRREFGQERRIPEEGLAVLRELRPFEAVFIDLQCLDLRLESRPGNAQSGSGP